MVSDKVNRRELEYVKLASYDKNIANINDTASDVYNCINSVPILNGLIVERHSEINKVKEISKEIIHLIKQMDNLLLKNKFGDVIHRRSKSEVYIQKDYTDKDAIESSKENLKNLRANLEKMEEHFKTI